MVRPSKLELREFKCCKSGRFESNSGPSKIGLLFATLLTLSGLGCQSMLGSKAEKSPSGLEKLTGNSPTGTADKNLWSPFGKLAKSKGVPKPPEKTSLAVRAKETPELYVAAAKYSESIGNLVNAEELYQKALKMDDKHPEAHVGVARIQLQTGRLNEARQSCEVAKGLGRENAVVQNEVAMVHWQLGDLDLAQQHFERAVELEPTNERARKNLANILVREQRVEEAFKQLASVYDPPTAHFHLAAILRNQHRFDEAHHELIRANTALASAPPDHKLRKAIQTHLMAEQGMTTVQAIR